MQVTEFCLLAKALRAASIPPESPAKARQINPRFTAARRPGLSLNQSRILRLVKGSKTKFCDSSENDEPPPTGRSNAAGVARRHY